MKPLMTFTPIILFYHNEPSKTKDSPWGRGEEKSKTNWERSRDVSSSYLSATSLVACWISWIVCPWSCSCCTTFSYSGCWGVRTRRGWLHTFLRYCNAYKTRKKGSEINGRSFTRLLHLSPSVTTIYTAVGCLLANCWPFIGRQTADKRLKDVRQRPDGQPTDCRKTVDKRLKDVQQRPDGQPTDCRKTVDKRLKDVRQRPDGQPTDCRQTDEESLGFNIIANKRSISPTWKSI